MILVKKGDSNRAPRFRALMHRNGSDLNCKRMSDVAVILKSGSHQASKPGLYIKELNC